MIYRVEFKDLKKARLILEKLILAFLHRDRNQVIIAENRKDPGRKYHSFFLKQQYFSLDPFCT